jgi:hypothetical protein
LLVFLKVQADVRFRCEEYFLTGVDCKVCYSCLMFSACIALQNVYRQGIAYQVRPVEL